MRRTGNANSTFQRPEFYSNDDDAILLKNIIFDLDARQLVSRWRYLSQCNYDCNSDRAYRYNPSRDTFLRITTEVFDAALNMRENVTQDFYVHPYQE